MSKNQDRELSADERHVLEHGHLRLLSGPQEMARCDQAIIQHHYLHDVTLVGEHLRYCQGTAYKVSGWCHLGKTAGWKRDAADFYEKNGAPKQIWVRKLVKKACRKLRAVPLSPEWAPVEASHPPRCTAKVQQIGSLMHSVQEQISEFRRAQALVYPVCGLVCLVVMANAQGLIRGPSDLADYADTLSQGQLRALKFRRDRRTLKVRCPKKTVFTPLLHSIDDDLLERLLLRWPEQILGPAQEQIIIIDGKKVRHAGVEIVNALDSARGGQSGQCGHQSSPKEKSPIQMHHWHVPEPLQIRPRRSRTPPRTHSRQIPQGPGLVKMKRRVLPQSWGVRWTVDSVPPNCFGEGMNQALGLTSSRPLRRAK